MLPDNLRKIARQTILNRKTVNLAVFGPGRKSPFFEKREAICQAVRDEHPGTLINFYMVDDRVQPSKNYEDYLDRVRPAEIEQIDWADVILFLVTHHRLTALVEYILVRDLHSESDKKPYDKCGLALSRDLEVSPLWVYEAKRTLQMKGPAGTERIIEFTADDLNTCHVAKDLAVELFQRVVIDRWSFQWP
jgi:hypothetical protein